MQRTRACDVFSCKWNCTGKIQCDLSNDRSSANQCRGYLPTFLRPLNSKVSFDKKGSCE